MKQTIRRGSTFLGLSGTQEVRKHMRFKFRKNRGYTYLRYLDTAIEAVRAPSITKTECTNLHMFDIGW